MLNYQPFSYIFPNGIKCGGTSTFDVATFSGIATFNSPAIFNSAATFASNTAVAYASTDTTDYRNGPAMIARNASATAGNFTAVRFQTANSYDYAAMYGVCTTHTAGSGTGYLVWAVADASNTPTARMWLSEKGNLGVGAMPSAWTSGYKAVGVGQAGNAVYASGSDADIGIVANGYYDGTNWKYVNSDYYAALTVANGALSFHSGVSGTAGNNVTLVKLLELNKGKTLALEGASAQVGTGITFPATANLASDVNTLDDYQEGTFTPTVSGDTGSPTYTVQSGNYVKIGRFVQVNARLEFNKNTCTGSMYLGGLPFSFTSDASDVRACGVFGYSDRGSLFVFATGEGGTSCHLISGGTVLYGWASVASTAIIYYSLAYQTDAV